jgi:hypothetical protein
MMTNRQIQSSQIADVLAAITHLSAHLRAANAEPAVDSGGTPKEAPPRLPEATLALENSLIKACDRLDQIIGNAAQWAAPGTDVQTLLTAQTAQQIKLQAHHIIASEIQLSSLQRSASQTAQASALFNQLQVAAQKQSQPLARKPAIKRKKK